jgi:ParB family chromosome partitioning protein
VQDYVREGKLSAGHARTLINTENPVEAAIRIIEQGMSVRDAESLRRTRRGKAGSARQVDPDTRAAEKALSDHLGLTVTINHRANGGSVRIAYKTLEQLDDLCRRLGSN